MRELPLTQAQTVLVRCLDVDAIRDVGGTNQHELGWDHDPNIEK